MADSSGNLTASTNYDSFGNASNQSFPIRYQFTGREFDATTGLHHYRARQYDANLGRFISEDPIGFAGIDRDGSEVILAIIVGGEPFGELCFCGGPTERRNSIARATAESVALEITLEDFVEYMRQTEEILGKFLFTICIRLAHAERRIGILAMRRVEERLGHALLHLAQTRGVPINSDRTDELKLAVTHEELAGMTALSRQRVTIMMNRFRKLGLVQYSRQQPLIININLLAKHIQQ